MSVNKIKSLKLRRNYEVASTLEEPSTITTEETKTERIEKSSKHQEIPTPVHSTPKRSSCKPNTSQEQPDFSVSPMLLSCTQEGNEVQWDWQSPLTKSKLARRNGNNGEQIGTPKRTALLQKKRNSNSPLLFKPIKRIFMNNDNQPEYFETFTAEMKALSEQIKTVPRDDENRARENANDNINSTEDELMIEIDIEDFAEPEAKPAPKIIPNDTCARQKKEVSIVQTSLYDLFDDSIEDSMVKCSQEVEEKLRLESNRENSSIPISVKNITKDFSWHQQSYTKFLAVKDKTNEKNPISTSTLLPSSTDTQSSSSSRLSTKDSSKNSTMTLKTLSSSDMPKKSGNSIVKPSFSTKSSSSCLNINNNNNNVGASVSKTQNSVASSRTEIFEIPDDSFDEDFLDVCFDDVENSSIEKITSNNEFEQSSTRYGKCYVSPHAITSKEGGIAARKSHSTAARKLLLPPPSQSNSYGNAKIYEANSSITRSTFVQNSQSSSMATGTTTTTGTMMNSSRKFFKTKSLSTSNFDDIHSTDNRGKSTSSSSASSSSTSNVGSGTTSSKSWKNNSCVKKNPVSTQIQQQQQQQPTQLQRQQQQQQQRNNSSNAWSKKNGDYNNGIKNFDRNAARDDGNKLKIINDSTQRQNDAREVATGSQSTQICTPEEIERKRREAKMKLEMKRKLQARSKSAGLLCDFKTKGPPVKR